MIIVMIVQIVLIVMTVILIMTMTTEKQNYLCTENEKRRFFYNNQLLQHMHIVFPTAFQEREKQKKQFQGHSPNVVINN